MLYDTLKHARSDTSITFVKRLADAHHFVRLPSGKWCRTLGPPSNADLLPGRALVQVTNNTWHIEVIGGAS